MSTQEPEEISSAAIRFGDTVLTGGCHDTIRAEYCRMFDAQGSGHGTSGFVTTTSRFVDRHEAAYIAFAAGQIREQVPELHSEDLRDHVNIVHHIRLKEGRE
ncbi:hypothetical protein FJY94_00685 [Candidatus Kaiserbacteria bacterium]|nr:hypothetical protein [Candidatus Kaiserbacteria bacterium]